MVAIKKLKGYERDRAFRIDEQAKINGVQSAYKKQVWLQQDPAGEWRHAPDTLFFRSKVRIKSALCAYLLIHGLTKLDHDMDSMKTRDFVKFLNKEYPQIMWDPVSVGKMMGDLADMTQTLWTSDGETRSFMPMIRDRNSAGYFYGFHQQSQTMFYLHGLLQILRPWAEYERDNPGRFQGTGTWRGKRGGDTAIVRAVHEMKNRTDKVGGVDEIGRAFPIWTFQRGAQFGG